MVMNVFDLLQASKKATDPSKFDINIYAEKTTEGKGKCRHCNRAVPWSRTRIISHKRANCAGISDDEKAFFHAQHALKTISARKRTRVPSSPDQAETEPRKQTRIQKTATDWIDQITVGERDAITRAMATLFFRTGIPFRVVESASMKDLISALRPAYAPHIPSARMLSGSLLSQHYDELHLRGRAFIADAPVYSIVSDGWSNSRNEHQVNYVILVPGQKPFFFLKSVSTAGIVQTSERIAADIMEVIEELGASKCVAVITDNASNMRGAWDIIESRYTLVFANGCGAHVMNLLIKDICSLPEFAETLADAMVVIKFVRNHQHVLSAFQSKRETFKIKHDLVLVVPTRWYSHYNACRYLRAAKFAVQALLEEDVAPVLKAIQNQTTVEKFKSFAGSPSFWSRLRKITSVLKFPSEIIGKFEKDNCDLYEVYNCFTLLQAFWDKKLALDSSLVAELKKIVTTRWNFIHTESMGFAYMLTPKSATMKWLPNDKINTKNQLTVYIHQYYEGDDADACLNELNDYLTMYPTRSSAEINEYNSITGMQYWAQYGLSEFPLLASIAVRVFSVPTSSAAAERVWSIFSYLYSKRRNRMSMVKLEKLAFVYINHSLLDKLDKFDYIKAYLEDDDGDEDGTVDELESDLV